MTLHQLPDIDIDMSTVNLQAHISRAISDNWKNLDTNANWVQLFFLKSLYIKQLKSKINVGLKASKELLYCFDCSFIVFTIFVNLFNLILIVFADSL